MMKIKLLLGVLLLALLSACATTPQNNTALQHADSAVTAASRDDNVQKYAPVALEKAKDTLKQAESAWKDEGNKTQTDHLAYLARRRAQIAQAMGEKGHAQDEAKQAQQQRESLKSRARKSKIEELKNKLSSLNPHQTDKGIVLTIGNVLFAFDSAKLKSAAQAPLDKLASFLHSHEDVRVQVNGYTDSVGSRAYNQELSEKRAQSVADAMIARGIESRRMNVVGHGENDPVASNSTASGRQQNRRVEFVLLNTAKQPRDTSAPSAQGST